MDKKTEIGTNFSSGAEKVENIQKLENGERAKPFQDQSNAQNFQNEGGRVEMNVKKEEAEAQKRVERAKAKEAEKLAREHRAKQRKALAKKRIAERKEKAEKRMAQKEAQMRERARLKANRREERKRQANRGAQNQGNENKNRRKENGGWLAAVISLGAITLALTSALTVGAIEMKKMNDGVMGGYKSTAFELVGIMEHVDDDLDRIRISASPVQQERILTDLLVQSRLAALDLEKMPIDGQADSNLTSFINRVGKTSEGLLTKLRLGESLSEKDLEMLDWLYQTNHGIKAKVEEISTSLDDNMLMEYLKRGEGKLQEVLNGIEEFTLAENGKALEKAKQNMPNAESKKSSEQGEKSKMEGAGIRRSFMPDQNFSENKGKIDPAKAEEICTQYFQKYQINDFQCVGETVGKGYTAYNLQGYDQKGTLLFAEVDVASGKLVRFDYFEPCVNARFDMENAQRLAEEFLQSLGYENMEAVRVRENGTDADFTFVYTMDKVRIDPDEVKVKICRDRGVVTAFDALKYLKNHKQRTISTPKLSMEEAKEKLHEKLDFEKGELALVKAKGGERLAYEMVCCYGKEKYFIYLDADTGNEIAILNAKNR